MGAVLVLPVLSWAECAATQYSVAKKHCIHLQELSNDPLNILRPATKLQHSLNLASAYCGPPEHHENDHRRGRRHESRPHEPKVSKSRLLLLAIKGDC